MKHTKTTLLALAAALGLAGAANAQSTVFAEDFGSLADSTEITTSNTTLTYARVGTQGGSIAAQNPSAFGAGASAVITGPTGGSLNGLGVASGLDFGTNTEISFATDFRLSASAGTVVFGLGSGTAFTGNSTFTTNDGLFWLQANGLDFQRREGGSWVGVETLALNTNYSLLVEANLTSQTMTISLNGTAVASDVALTTPGINPDGFRIYSVNGSNVQLDNISLTAVPEPGSFALIAGLLGLTWVMLRRRS